MSEPYPVRDLSSPFDNSADAPPPLYNPNYDEPPAFPAPEENSEQTKARVIESFQSAILKSQVELVHLLLDTQLFDINDLPLNRQTFLCAALSTGQNNLAREFIVKYGADVNAWSIEGWDRINRPIYRTPLMVAASKGNYAAVKMLMEEFGVDDGVVGADGMIALRCAVRAAKDGVGEGDKCVEYLPMRRSGGWKRFKHDHDITMRVVKKTTKGLIAVGKFFVYDLPKFLFWDFPKWLGKKVYKMCKATYEGTLYFFNTILPRALKGTVNGLKNLSKAMAKFIASIPGHLVDLIKYLVFEAPKVIYNMCKSLVTEILPKAAVETWNGVVRVSKFVRWVVVGTAKWTWTLCTRRIPKWIWEFTKWFFRWLHKIIFIRLPKLIKEAAMALKRGAIKVYETIVGLLASIASTIHTFVAFIIRSLGKVTLKDVFNSIYNLIHYVVVVIPTTIAKGIANGFKFVIDAIPKIFGFLGEMMVLLGKCLFVIIMFVPMSIGKLVWEFVKWVGRGIQEVMVWINPKAKVGR